MELVALKLKTFHKHMSHINYLSIHLPERNEDTYLYKVCAHIHGGLLSDGLQTGSCPTLHRQVMGQASCGTLLIKEATETAM